MFAKLVLASILVAAYATETPTISLDLDGAGLRKKGEHYKSPWRSEKQANTKWVHHCKAKNKYAVTECALPKARAYDHHDTDVTVTSNICLINKAPKNGGAGNVMECGKPKPDYNLRAEYIIKYNAKDDSGNEADEVIFAVILDDEEPPTFTNWKSYTYECNKSAAGFHVRKPSARDNIDTIMAVTIDGATKKLERAWPVHSRNYKFATHDFANVFGYKSADNTFEETKTLVVQDTTNPVITDVPDWSIECSKGKIGTHKKAGCHDDCDHLSGEKKSVDVVGDATFMATSQRSFHVTYQCKDNAGRDATSTSTKVSITDNTRPTIDYYGNHVIEHSAGITDHMGNYLRGHWCKDSCVSNKKLEKHKKYSHIEFLTTGCTHSTKSTHGKAYFNTLKPGTYYQKFTCNDGNGNTAIAKCRTIINEDKTKPVITVLGSDEEVLEATYSENYVDDGATCSDQVDGVISQDVEVSGDVVNMGKRGLYRIHYNCKDTAGNAADQLTRKVRIVDITCPSCTMHKLNPTYREASFIYVDDGATCKDDIGLGKYKLHSTPGNVKYNVIGTYYVTYAITDEAGNNNDGKCPDCKWVKEKRCKGAKKEIRTVIVKDTLKPTIHLTFGKKTVHKSAAKDTGLNGQSNPAAKYMAETSSVNGWVIGAIASAVAGVALLALGTQKAAASVPV